MLKELLKESEQIAIMPFSRALLEHNFEIDEFAFFEPGALEFESLNPIENETFEELCDYKLSGDIDPQDGNKMLRRATTSLTKFDLEVLKNHPVVVFPVSIDMDKFLNFHHQEDVDLIKKLSFMAEKAMDMIRFELCRLDLPDTLPGTIGSWEGSSDYLGVLVYDKRMDKSFLIAGSAVESTQVVKGIGLEIDRYPYHPIPKPEYGELASYAHQALMLLTDAMSAPNSTVKFMRVMGLLEFLASPNEYQTWKKIKCDLACHIAKDKTKYHTLLDRFRTLTSLEDANGNQVGYRTLVVHQGKYLPDLVGSHEEVSSLFKELQYYASCVIRDMMDNPSWSWAEFSQYRDNLKINLGVK